MEDNGLMDAAILLMSLGEDTASEVFKHLSPKEVQRLGETMASVKTTRNDKVGEVLEKFRSETADSSTLVGDTDAYIRNVLTRALGEDKAGLLIDRILQGGDVSGIESLKWMDAASVGDLIRNEHPQIIASILVHLERDHACGILQQFNERTRTDVMLRIATLDGIPPNALNELNEIMERQFAGNQNLKASSIGGVKVAANILNFMDSGQDQVILGSITQVDADLGARIQDLMFVFDNLADLGDRELQALLREVPNDRLGLALRGADAKVKEKITRNMSQRAAQILLEDMEARGPVRLSEVEAEQKEILKTVRRLAEEGQVMLGGKGGDDGFV